MVEITCLPASWHNHSEKIVPGVRRKVDAALRTKRNVAVVYGDCGTGGELDAYLEQVGVPRIPGPHCYKMFLGKPVFDDEMDNVLETFFLTDYMVRHFERIVMGGWGYAGTLGSGICILAITHAFFTLPNQRIRHCE